MSLNFGTIHGAIKLDTKQWTKSLDAAFKAGDKMVAGARTTYGRGGTQAGTAFAGGVQKGTSSVGAQVGKTLAGVQQKFTTTGKVSGAGFADGVTTGTDTIGSSVGRLLDGVRTRFGRSGTQAGDAFTDGVRKGADPSTMMRDVTAGLKDQPTKFGRAGQDSGESFTEGTTRGASRVGASISRLLSSTTGRVLATAAALGAAIGAIIAQGIAQHLDVEQATDKLSAALGLTTVEAGRIGRLAGKMYSDNFGESIDAVGEAFQAAFRTGLVNIGQTDADIERVTGKLITLADVLDQDVAMTAEAVGNIMRNGLARDVDEAMDVVTRAIQAGADKAGDLTETFQEYSVQFAKVGLNAAEAAGLITQGLVAGARDADTVGDTLKEFAIKSQEAMSETTVVADRSAAAIKRVISAERSLADTHRGEMRAIQSLTDARADALQQLKDLANESEDAALTQESAELALLRAKERLAELPADATALDRREATLAVKQATKALEDQKAKVAELADRKAKADAAGVDGSESVLNAFYGILQAQQDQRDAADDLREARNDLAGSYGYERKELTALGKAYQSIGLDGEDIQKRIAAGGDIAKGALDDVLDALRNTEDPVLRNAAAVAIFGTKAEDMADALYALDVTTAVDQLGDVTGAVDDLGRAYDNNATKVEQGKRKILGQVGGLVDGFIALWDDGRFFDTDMFKFGAEEILGWFAPLGRAFTGFGDDAQEMGRKVIDTWKGIAGFLDQKWEAIKAAFTTGRQKITDMWTRTWESVKSTVGGALISVATWVSGTFNGIVSFVTGLPGRMAAAAGAMWTWVTNGISNAFSAVVGWLDTLVLWVRTLPARIGAAVSGMWDGLKHSFRGALNWIIDQWNNFGFTFPEIDVPVLGKIGGWVFDTPHIPPIPEFHTGTGPGGVPGLPGREVLAKLMPGETVRTVPQERDLRAAMSQLAATGLARATVGAGGLSGAPVVRSGDGGTVVHLTLPITFKGTVTGPGAEKWVTDTVASAARKGILTARDLPRAS